MIEYTAVKIKEENIKPHLNRLIGYMERNLTRKLGPKAETAEEVVLYYITSGYH